MKRGLFFFKHCWFSKVSRLHATKTGHLNIIIIMIDLELNRKKAQIKQTDLCIPISLQVIRSVS